MAGFATAADVASALKRTFTPAETLWVEDLLEQSAGYVRDVIGQHIYPPVTATFTAWPVYGRVDLPQSFVGEIIAVQRGGQDVPFERFEDSIIVEASPVDVTFMYGAIDPPASLVGVNVAMVSSAIILVEADLGVAIGGLSSLALDDFKIAFANGGDQTGHMTLPVITAQNLRDRFGAGSGSVNTQ